MVTEGRICLDEINHSVMRLGLRWINNEAIPSPSRCNGCGQKRSWTVALLAVEVDLLGVEGMPGSCEAEDEEVSPPDKFTQRENEKWVRLFLTFFLLPLDSLFRLFKLFASFCFFKPHSRPLLILLPFFLLLHFLSFLSAPNAQRELAYYD